jgi:pimeloyl-ACP methyl ester carboxylesterase
VPLGYTIPPGPRSSIPLINFPAWTNTTYKGMVRTNPGGPGESGLDFLIRDGDYLSNVIGRNYDLVSWDPRGIGYSIPAADCSPPNTASNTTYLRLRRRAKTVPRIKLAQLNDCYVEDELEVARTEGLIL